MNSGISHWTGRLWTLIILTALVTAWVLPAPTTAQVPFGPGAMAKDRPINTLADLNHALIDIVSDVRPTVVTVSTERIVTARMPSFGLPFGNDDFFDFFFGPRNRRGQPEEREFRQRGLGSGVIVSEDGYILTNNHVVRNADTIFVRTLDDKRYTAKIVGTDPQTDIAVLKIDADGLDYIRVGDSDQLQVGEMVIAVGSPMSENLASTVTQGIVSATGRSNVGLAEYEDFIQTDAAINPGNSGGPLINLNGELVGINTAIASRSGGFQGIGFAVPANMAMRIMRSLVSEGRVVRGWLGVYIQDVSNEIADAMDLDESSGALVSDVIEDSPADKAGVEVSDIIKAVDGRDIASSSELRNTIASTPPNETIELTVLRDGERRTLGVTLGELTPEVAESAAGGDLREMLGFSVGTLTDELAARYGIEREAEGVVVTSIDATSAAYRAGLREGDLIRSANQQRVSNVAEFEDAMADREPGDKVLFHIMRDGRSFFVAFAL